jgi:Fe-S cluster assembly protein SufD
MPIELIEKPRDPVAWNRFLELGLPTKDWEVFRYVRLNTLYSKTFKLPMSPIPEIPRQKGLVLVNGDFHPELSIIPEKFIVLPLAEAYKTYGGFLQARMQKLLREEKDPFAVLNAAYCDRGLFVYIPPKTISETELEIFHFVTPSASPTLVSPRIHLFSGRHSSAKVSFFQETPQASMCINTFLDFSLDEGAFLSFASVSMHDETSHDFLALRASLKERSTFRSCVATNGGETSRHDFLVGLNGEGADASLSGAWHLKGDRQHHVNIFVDHQAPACNSLQKFKGILADASLSSFEGKIYVHDAAQKTSAYQMNHNLLIGESASANSKPNLEIYADDVKASHGATVGQLDKEQIFYLTARGIPQEKAQRLLISGFSQEIVALIENEMLKKKAAEILA